MRMGRSSHETRPEGETRNKRSRSKETLAGRFPLRDGDPNDTAYTSPKGETEKKRLVSPFIDLPDVRVPSSIGEMAQTVSEIAFRPGDVAAV